MSDFNGTGWTNLRRESRYSTEQDGSALERLGIWAEIDSWIIQYRAYTNCTIEEAVYVFAENDGLTPLEVFLKKQETDS